MRRKACRSRDLHIHVGWLLGNARMVAVEPKRSMRFCQEKLCQEKKTPGCERIETRRHSRAIAWGQFWQPNRVAYRSNWVIKPTRGAKVSPPGKKFSSR